MSESQLQTKMCHRCKTEKPTSAFYKANGHLYSACAECCKKEHKGLAYRKSTLARHAVVKLEVLSHYGKDGKPICVVCGENRISCLSIDHINGGGMKHRKEVSNGHGGSQFYYWLKHNNYPAGYQTLCMNDNFLKLMQYENHNRRKKP